MKTIRWSAPGFTTAPTPNRRGVLLVRACGREVARFYDRYGGRIHVTPKGSVYLLRCQRLDFGFQSFVPFQRAPGIFSRSYHSDKALFLRTRHNLLVVKCLLSNCNFIGCEAALERAG